MHSPKGRNLIEYGVVLASIACIASALFFIGEYTAKGFSHLSSSYETYIAQTASSTGLLLRENESLRLDLENALADIEDKEHDINRLEGKVDKLNTIVKTDPELLAKYSKVYFLNENYAPTSVKTLDEAYVYPTGKVVEFHGKLMDELEDLFEDATEDGVELFGTSGYRSFEEQMRLKSAYTVSYGAGANKFSADQGFSEHQLGTTIDFVTSASGVTLAFENTTAFTWLTENAHKYGFVLSYPKGNAYYVYEPWHWRYVGKKLATKLHRDEQNFYDLDQRDIDKYILYFFND